MAVLRLRDAELNLDAPVVMGVLNLTPDSFSDGGRYLPLESALQRAREIHAEGAAIIDVGGESTRPGAAPVSEQQELDRVLPVIERIARELDVVISVDTMKPAVMRAAAQVGAALINDVNALRAPGALQAVADAGVAVCLMHMQGEPRTMQVAPRYADVVSEVDLFLRARVAACVDAGIARERIVLDPGIGFGKTLEHNLSVLAALARLNTQQLPLLVGASRKSLFQQLLGRPMEARLPGGLAVAALAVWQGVAIVRAHDVRATVDAVKVAHAVREAREES